MAFSQLPLVGLIHTAGSPPGIKSPIRGLESCSKFTGTWESLKKHPLNSCDFCKDYGLPTSPGCAPETFRHRQHWTTVLTSNNIMFVDRVALASMLAGLIALLACTVVLSAGTVAGSSSLDQVSKTQTVRLTKLLDEVRRLSELNRLVELKVQAALLGGGPDGGAAAAAVAEQKREATAAWDMDYGWGGGRFGKRMDSLGIAGRFGRSVSEEPSISH